MGKLFDTFRGPTRPSRGNNRDATDGHGGVGNDVEAGGAANVIVVDEMQSAELGTARRTVSTRSGDGARREPSVEEMTRPTYDPYVCVWVLVCVRVHVWVWT